MRSTGLSVAVAALMVGAPAGAETLREALAKAYATNPTLNAERANVRANDETVPRARAAGRPEALVSTSYTENFLNSPGVQNSFTSPDRQLIGQVNLTVPVLTFGAVRGAVRAAEERAGASRYNLRGVEADLFTSVVSAYMDVIRDEAVVRLNEQNVRVLEVNLKASADRFEAGSATPTDVAQSRGRLALAQSQLENTRGRLVSSRETYVRLVGDAPGELAPPPPLPNLPGDLAAAERIALENNPNLLAAQRSREATAGDLQVARAATMPRVNAVLGGNYYDYLNSLRENPFSRTFQASSTASAGIEFRVPLYQGGRAASQVREAQARRTQATEQVFEAERAVVAQVRSAFAVYRASQEVIATSRTAVAANRESLQGVRAEASAGLRSVLDVLNAAQELLNSEVTLVTAERDAYVAGFALLGAMGRAEARDLGLQGGPLYDPTTNYERVKRHWLDFDDTPEPAAAATTTRAVPPQDARVRQPQGPGLPEFDAVRTPAPTTR